MACLEQHPRQTYPECRTHSQSCGRLLPLHGFSTWCIWAPCCRDGCGRRLIVPGFHGSWPCYRWVRWAQRWSHRIGSPGDRMRELTRSREDLYLQWKIRFYWKCLKTKKIQNEAKRDRKQLWQNFWVARDCRTAPRVALGIMPEHCQEPVNPYYPLGKIFCQKKYVHSMCSWASTMSDFVLELV